jgi:hypothetical protein
VNESTLVWKKGMHNWLPIGKVDLLQNKSSVPSMSNPQEAASPGVGKEGRTKVCGPDTNNDEPFSDAASSTPMKNPKGGGGDATPIGYGRYGLTASKVRGASHKIDLKFGAYFAP